VSRGLSRLQGPPTTPAVGRRRDTRIGIEYLGALFDADRTDIEAVSSGDNVNVAVRASTERAVDELVLRTCGKPMVREALRTAESVLAL
jgi:hypothetical protein